MGHASGIPRGWRSPPTIGSSSRTTRACKILSTRSTISSRGPAMACRACTKKTPTPPPHYRRFKCRIPGRERERSSSCRGRKRGRTSIRRARHWLRIRLRFLVRFTLNPSARRSRGGLSLQQPTLANSRDGFLGTLCGAVSPKENLHRQRLRQRLGGGTEHGRYCPLASERKTASRHSRDPGGRKSIPDFLHRSIDKPPRGRPKITTSPATRANGRGRTPPPTPAGINSKFKRSMWPPTGLSVVLHIPRASRRDMSTKSTRQDRPRKSDNALARYRLLHAQSDARSSTLKSARIPPSQLALRPRGSADSQP